MTFIPENLHPGAVTETKQESATAAPKELPVPVAGRLDAPTSASVTPSNCVMARRENWIHDRAEPNTTVTNAPGTTTKVYGPDGWVQKEHNKGHQGARVPRTEQSDHVHDYKPPPYHPDGKPTRQPGRPPKRNELKKDFGQ